MALGSLVVAMNLNSLGCFTLLLNLLHRPRSTYGGVMLGQARFFICGMFLKFMYT